MSDHAHDLQLLQEAMDRLLPAVGKLDNAALGESSRLPGWTRGHVLAHLARNADALVNVLEGRPMYASAEAREADIARGAARPLSEHLTDLHESHERIRLTASVPADWSRTVELRNGVTDTAANVLFRRLIEVELHHVDLGIGYELGDLSEEFTSREIRFLADRWSGHADVPPVILTATDGRQWQTGGSTGTPARLSGTPAELLAWLSGRGDKGAALVTTDGPLPALPPL
ncbi:maleylpyruvate isomerase family mycothiol-dependent enzyme [Streptomyces sp. NPDC006879]|uniref:maleylpyruvate isomerase family mycothiol-dependent enzyme n=1 Tax=Streptomyces sp. NPDC006879 TaxID=3364767 RepID=UPI0036A02B5D